MNVQHSHNAIAKSIFLRFEECAFRIRGPAADISWLTSFLGCGFEERPSASPNYEVEFVVNSNEFDELSSEGSPLDGPPVVGFAHDAKVTTFGRWASNDTTDIFHDAPHRIFYFVMDHGVRVRILARENTRQAHMALMRVIRELAMDWVAASGGTLLHGAAIHCDFGVIAICGPKRSGKTTLLLSLLETTSAMYVANDRCVLRESGAWFTVRGLPTIVSIRDDTVDQFLSLQDQLRNSIEVVVSPQASPDGCRAAEPPSTKYTMSPAKFQQLTGCRCASSGPLLALVFPRITNTSTGMKLCRLDAADALPRFYDGLFRALQRQLLGDVFAPRSSAGLRPREVADRVGPAIGATIPCFDCELESGKVPSSEQCHQFLTTVRNQARNAGNPKGG